MASQVEILADRCDTRPRSHITMTERGHRRCAKNITHRKKKVPSARLTSSIQAEEMVATVEHRRAEPDPHPPAPNRSFPHSWKLRPEPKFESGMFAAAPQCTFIPLLPQPGRVNILQHFLILALEKTNKLRWRVSSILTRPRRSKPLITPHSNSTFHFIKTLYHKGYSQKGPPTLPPPQRGTGRENKSHLNIKGNSRISHHFWGIRHDFVSSILPLRLCRRAATSM